MRGPAAHPYVFSGGVPPPPGLRYTTHKRKVEKVYNTHVHVNVYWVCKQCIFLKSEQLKLNCILLHVYVLGAHQYRILAVILYTCMYGSPIHVRIE